MQINAHVYYVFSKCETYYHIIVAAELAVTTSFQFSQFAGYTVQLPPHARVELVCMMSGSPQSVWAPSSAGGTSGLRASLPPDSFRKKRLWLAIRDTLFWSVIGETACSRETRFIFRLLVDNQHLGYRQPYYGGTMQSALLALSCYKWRISPNGHSANERG